MFACWVGEATLCRCVLGNRVGHTVGNGRPFAVRIVESSMEVTPELLDAVMTYINDGVGPNSQRDVSVRHVVEVRREDTHTVHKLHTVHGIYTDEVFAFVLMGK